MRIRFPSRASLALCSVTLLAQLPGTASAAFLRVDPSGGGDYLTIQAAMSVAAPGDTLAARSGNHFVNNVQVKEGVQVLGGWNAAFTNRVPGTSHLIATTGGCIFRLNLGQTTATLIDGFEMSGAGEAAVWLTTSSATISNNNIHDNSAADGAAVHCEYGASPVIVYNHVHHNTATYGGGLRGHWGSGTSPVIRHNVIEYNQAFSAGGGIGVNNGSPIIEDNVIRFNSAQGTGGGVHVWHAGGGTVQLRRNLIINNAARDGGGIGINGGHPIIENNTLWANDGSSGGALSYAQSELPEPGTTQVSHNILGGSTSGTGVYCINLFTIALNCNCVFGNAAGDYFACPPAVGDFHSDPAFCDLIGFLITSNSPCAPSGSCGLVGAYPVGCGAVSIEPTTWAHLKAAFRGQ